MNVAYLLLLCHFFKFYFQYQSVCTHSREHEREKCCRHTKHTRSSILSVLSINFVLFAPIFIWLEMCKYIKKRNVKKRQHKYINSMRKETKFQCEYWQKSHWMGVSVSAAKKSRELNGGGSVCVLIMSKICNIYLIILHTCVSVFILVVFFAFTVCGIYRCHTQFLSSTSHRINIYKTPSSNWARIIGAIPFLSWNLWHECVVCVFASWFEYALHQYLAVVDTLQYLNIFARKKKVKRKGRKRIVK